LLSKQWFNHHFNGEKYYSENGLKDLLEATINVEDLEYLSFIKRGDIEIALTHKNPIF
jgi:topoisomerase-4 subunit B